MRETDDPADRHHGRRRQHDARRAQLLALGSLGGLRGNRLARQLSCGTSGDNERGNADHQRSSSTEVTDPEQRTDREGTDQPRDQAEFGVGLDQLILVAHHAGHQRRLRHRVGLLHHQGHEHQRVEQDVVGVKCHQHVERGAHDGGDLYDHLATAGDPVDGGPDQRGDDDERRKADDQIPQHGRALRVRAEAEHLACDCAVHRCVADGDEGVCASQPTKRRL